MMGYPYRVFSVLVALLCALAVASAYGLLSGKKDDKCETLTYDVCLKMDYNRTIFPNYLGHRKQAAAVVQVNVLRPLLAVGCSIDLLTFVCSVYFPMCTSINKIIPPCRSLCIDVRNGCLPVMKTFGYVWPNELKCDQFPVLGTDICVFQNKTGAPNPKRNFTISALTNTPKMNTSMKTTKKVRSPLRERVKKYCPAVRVQKKQWKSVAQKDCCSCCLRGNRAARLNISTCSLKGIDTNDKSVKKSIKKSVLKSLKACSTRKSSRCYQDCCNAKKMEMKRSKTRRNRNRRSRNRNRNRRRRQSG